MRRYTFTAMAGTIMAGLSITPTAAVARDDPGATRLVDDIARCRGIAADAERLACFDQAATSLVSARERGDLLVMDRERVVERKRARFGLAMDDNNVFGGGAEDQATEVKALDTTIQSVGGGPYGRYNLQLANGSVWQTTEPVRFPPRSGQDIHLEKGLLGSFKATINKSTVVKVKRLS